MCNKVNAIGTVFKNALKLFLKNDPLRMARATAFFTMFALPPILLLLVQVFSLFINPQTIRQEMFTGLSEVLGQEAVRQVVSVIRAVRKLNFNWPATILGFIFLLFVATTVFKITRSSIDQIWETFERETAGKKALATLQLGYDH